MPPLDDASFPTVPASAPSEAFDVPLCVACGVGTDSVAMLVGLWRSTVKGCRGATARPGSMTTFILAHRAERARRSLPVLND